MRDKLVAILGGVLLGAVGPVQADPYFFIEPGHSIQPLDGKTLGLLNVGVELQLPWRWQAGRLFSKLELSAGYADTRNGGVFRGVAMPLLRYQPAATGWFLEGGIGVAYVSNTRWRPGHDLGTRWLFAERLGVGYDFGKYDLSLNLGHMSNGGLNKANAGAESVGIRFALSY